MSAIAIIPARGGSVRIPRKNIKLFHGRPIIEYSIETAKRSGLFSLVVVSTDDEEIKKIALAARAVVVDRDPDDGTKGTQEVAAEVLKNFPSYELACVIYPTSPLLMEQDLICGRAALQTPQPFMFAMSVGAEPLRDAGCFYWGHIGAFIKRWPLIHHTTAMIRLPESRVCDINTPEDWARAESMYEALRRAQ